MATIKVSYTIREGKFSLKVQKGSDTAKYRVVKFLKNPNLNRWDNSTQRFEEATNEAIANNQLLASHIQPLQSAIDEGTVTTIEQVDYFWRNGGKVEAKVVLTLGAYIQQLIKQMRTESIKLPSKNYQNYITLLHKLEEEGNIIKTPISETGDVQMRALSLYIRTKLNGVNYKRLMSCLHSTINKAKHNGLSGVVLSYDATIDQPTNRKNKTDNEVDVLTKKQYQQFMEFDLSTLKKRSRKFAMQHVLFRDFCIFMYEMKIRPCDVVALHSSNIKFVGKDQVESIVYTPIKKKNYLNERDAQVENPLTPKAIEIIERYKGISDVGYIFPFAFNINKRWDLSNAEEFNTWHHRKQYAITQVNTFLKLFKSILGVKVLTPYTFRHTTFSHEINANIKPLMRIAKEGGTSVEKLEKHYYNQFAS